MITASSADEVCSPIADPCIIDQIFELDGVLDFGLRQVLVTGGGRLRGSGFTIHAGSIVIDVGPNTNTAVVEAEFGVAFTARGSCAGSPATSCFENRSCPSGDFCDTANARLDLDGRFNIRGGGFRAAAAGDVRLAGVVNVSGLGPAAVGGDIEVESRLGTLLIEAKLNAASSPTALEYGESGGGGVIDLRAGTDLTVDGILDFSGRSYGGQLDLAADRDILISNEMDGSAGSYSYANGGYFFAEAKRDFRMLRPSNVQRDLLTNVSGGGSFDPYYGYWSSGSGGNFYVDAYRDIEVGRGMTVRSDAGPGSVEGRGGYIQLFAEDGDVTVGGRLFSRGLGAPKGGIAGYISLESGYGSVLIEEAGLLDTTGGYGHGSVGIGATKQVRLAGTINVQALGGVYPDGEPQGTAGGVYVTGWRDGPDILIEGTILGGATGSADGEVLLEGCHLRITDGALIDLRRGPTNPEAQELSVNSAESLVVEDGARILLDSVHGRSSFGHRAEKPPTLLGTIEPAPFLFPNNGPGCPRCGNSEIDQTETCDDGNTVSADGCSDECVSEACIASTVGWPTSALCNDNDNCTIDSCSPLRSACEHRPVCDDGVACTVDSCAVDGTCGNQADDALCDDQNDCTDDFCHAVTDCGGLARNAVACDDYDPCTADTICSAGACVAPAELRRARSMRVGISHSSRANNDSARFVAVVNSDEFAANPTLTGLVLRVSDSLGNTVWSYSVPASEIRDQDGAGLRYRYYARERVGDDAPARRVNLKFLRDADTGHTALRLRLRRADLAALRGLTSLTAAWGMADAVPDQSCVSAWRMECSTKRQRLACRL